MTYLHYFLSGTVVYSPQITNGANFTSAGGEPLTFTSNVSLAFIAQLIDDHSQMLLPVHWCLRDIWLL
jgi:hypothetical protein